MQDVFETYGLFKDACHLVAGTLTTIDLAGRKIGDDGAEVLLRSSSATKPLRKYTSPTVTLECVDPEPLPEPWSTTEPSML